MNNTFVYVLLAVVMATWAIGFCWLLVKAQAMACKRCKFKGECDKHAEDNDYIPQCEKDRMKNRQSDTPLL